MTKPKQIYVCSTCRTEYPTLGKLSRFYCSLKCACLSRVVKDDGCWSWTGAKTEHGYPQINWQNKRIMVHRNLYETINGPLGELKALHRCDNPGCVNPDHIFAGTQMENMQDMLAKGRANRKLENYVRGENVHGSKLTAEQVLLIRNELAGGAYIRVTARKWKVSFSAIQEIRCRKTWKHI